MCDGLEAEMIAKWLKNNEVKVLPSRETKDGYTGLKMKIKDY